MTQIGNDIEEGIVKDEIAAQLNRILIIKYCIIDILPMRFFFFFFHFKSLHTFLYVMIISVME